jgi:hypothetical protein
MKTCYSCQIEKPKSEFTKSSRSKDGLRYECRECNLDQHKKWRAKNPEGYRLSNKKASMKIHYGLDHDRYEAMLADQGGKCRICGDAMNPPHVDHCHDTGRVRGLLCNACNLGIGFLHHSPERIRAAIAYLKSETDAERGG